MDNPSEDIQTYPNGSFPLSKGGSGIFTSSITGEALEIWLDTAILQRDHIRTTLEHDGAQIVAFHHVPTVHLLILSPRSVAVFDTYCHPDWLTPAVHARYMRRRAQGPAEVEEWTRKVFLKAGWVDKCIAAGRFLGVEDDWGGCRVGGPPLKASQHTQPLMVDTPLLPEITTQPPDEYCPAQDVPSLVEINIIPATQDRPVEADDTVSVAASSPEAIEEIEESPVKGMRSQWRGLSAEMEGVVASVEASEDVNEPMDVDVPVEVGEIAESPAVEDPSRVGVNEPPLHERDAPEEDHLEANERHMTAGTRLVEEEPAHEETISGDVGHAPSNVGVDMEIDGQSDEEVDMELPMATNSSPASASAIKHVPAPAVQATDPKRIFTGLKFWVDPIRPSRMDLIKRILAAGGKICANHSEATHVVIHTTFKQSQWEAVISDGVKEGRWFLLANWVTTSLDAGRRQPELGYTVPGGAAHKVAVPVETKVSTLRNSAGKKVKKSVPEIIKAEGEDVDTPGSDVDEVLLGAKAPLTDDLRGMVREQQPLMRKAIAKRVTLAAYSLPWEEKYGDRSDKFWDVFAATWAQCLAESRKESKDRRESEVASAQNGPGKGERQAAVPNSITAVSATTSSRSNQAEGTGIAVGTAAVPITNPIATSSSHLSAISSPYAVTRLSAVSPAPASYADNANHPVQQPRSAHPPWLAGASTPSHGTVTSSFPHPGPWTQSNASAGPSSNVNDAIANIRARYPNAGKIRQPIPDPMTKTKKPNNTKSREYGSRIPVAEMRTMFEEQFKAEQSGVSVKVIVAGLFERVGIYKKEGWRAQYEDWKMKRGKFAESVKKPTSRASQCHLRRERRMRSELKLAGLMSTEELDKIFVSEVDTAAAMGGIQSFSKYLVDKYGTFPAGYWRKVYAKWQKDAGRFADEEDEESETASEYSDEESEQSVQGDTGAVGASLSNRQMVKIFTELEEEGRESDSAARVGAILAERHGTYLQATWSQYLSDWRGKENRFAYLGSPPSGSPSADTRTTRSRANDVVPKPSQPASQTITTPIRPFIPATASSQAQVQTSRRMRVEDMVTIFEGYRADLESGKSQGTICELIQQEYGVYVTGTWSAMLTDWKLKRNRFEYLANAGDSSNTSNIPEEVTPAKRAVKAHYSDLLPRASGRGSASTSPSTTILRLEPSSQDSPGPSGSYRQNHPQSRMDAQEMIKIFEGYQTSIEKGMKKETVCGLIHEKYGTYSIRTWSNYFEDWKNKRARFAFLNTAGSQGSRDTDTPRAKRSAVAPAEGSQERSKKGTGRIVYTEEEERRMARYIVDRLPEETSASLKDWVAFQKQYPARTLGAYTEHYRGYKSRIDKYCQDLQDVRRLRKSKKTKKQSGVEGDSIMVVDDSDADSSVVYIEHESGDDEDVEIISVRSTPDLD